MQKIGQVLLSIFDLQYKELKLAISVHSQVIIIALRNNSYRNGYEYYAVLFINSTAGCYNLAYVNPLSKNHYLFLVCTFQMLLECHLVSTR